MEEFEKEVLQRLTKIETQLKTFNNLTTQVDRMDNDITILKEKLEQITGKISILNGAIISILISMCVAVLRFIFNI